MRKEVTYYAEDNTPFKSESECKKYEEKKKREHITAVQTAMYELDDMFWKKFYPNDTEASTEGRELHIAYMWLKNDITAILSDESINNKTAEQFIRAELINHRYGTEIMKWIEHDSIFEAVKIKRDFTTAIENMDYHDIASTLGYDFSKQDIKNLALLHKAKKNRKKIENLLTTCNFHYECGKFINKEYEEFLA